MGFFGDIAKRVDRFMGSDKNVQAAKLAVGNIAARGYGANGGFSYGSGSGAGYGDVAFSPIIEQDLLSRYADYEEMNQYPELAAALDIFADDATQSDSQLNKTVWITAKNENVQKILTDMLHKRLRIDEEIWEIARTLVQYGNDYEELLITNEGVVGLNFLPTSSMRRIEDCYGALLGFIQTYSGKVGFPLEDFEQLLAQRDEIRRLACADKPVMVAPEETAFEDWEVVHFRLRGSVRRSAYGFSVLEPARWIFKRLRMLEDSAILFRLQKAIERYAFYVDVGDMPPAEALAYVNKVRQQYRKKRFVNPTTGKLELSFDSAAPDEDFFVPAREGRDSTRIDVVSAPQWQHMDDIEYFRDKLFSAIKVPKSYLGQEQDVNRATLSAQDVQFARSVLRVQRCLKTGLGQICRVHLAALGTDPTKVEYDVNMTVPSAIFELAQIEVRNARADLAGRMQEFVSLRWMLSNIFGFSDQEIETTLAEKSGDVMRATSAQAHADKEATSINPEVGLEHLMGATTLRQLSENVRKRNKAKGYAGPITERELSAGDRDAEKRASAKLDQLLRSDRTLAKNLRRVQAMLEDIRDIETRRLAA